MQYRLSSTPEININNFFFSILLLVSTLGYAQKNILSSEVFDLISFNSVSLKDIDDSNGKKKILDSLFKQKGSLKLNSTSCPDLCADYRNEFISIHFYDDTGTGEHFYTLNLSVISTKVLVQIDDIEFKLGDHISNFKDKFKSYEDENGNVIISFMHNEFPAWHKVSFDEETGLITSIEFNQLM